MSSSVSGGADGGVNGVNGVNGVVNGGVSFWYADDGIPVRREPLGGDASADVVIVGGGYTGLWTAYYLKKAAPFLRVVVLEQKFCGYGASGRNGGWLYNGIAGRDRYAKLHGRDAAVRLQQAIRGRTVTPPGCRDRRGRSGLWTATPSVRSSRWRRRRGSTPTSIGVECSKSLVRPLSWLG